jgi:hypothetical protein
VRVGTVTKSWNDGDGKKWVLATVDTNTIEGKFVRNDLNAQVPVYGGLSLQHMYREYKDGSHDKEGVEVSICREPRRPGCKIVYTSEAPPYKRSDHRDRMDPTEQTEPKIETKVDVSKVPPTEADTPSTTQLMSEVVEASRKNVELQQQLEEKSAALDAIQAKEQASADLALQKQSQLASELGDAVLEHVAKLDPNLANEETTTAINLLREKYPGEVARLLEVACCASKHARDLEQQLAKQKEDSDRRMMEQAYHSAVAAKPGCHGVSVEEPVLAHAQKRARTETNPYAARDEAPAGLYDTNETLEQIRTAYNGLKGRGSVVDTMKAVANIIPRQRQAGFR